MYWGQQSENMSKWCQISAESLGKSLACHWDVIAESSFISCRSCRFVVIALINCTHHDSLRQRATNRGATEGRGLDGCTSTTRSFLSKGSQEGSRQGIREGSRSERLSEDLLFILYLKNEKGILFIIRIYIEQKYCNTEYNKKEIWC